MSQTSTKEPIMLNGVEIEDTFAETCPLSEMAYSVILWVQFPYFLLGDKASERDVYSLVVLLRDLKLIGMN